LYSVRTDAAWHLAVAAIAIPDRVDRGVPAVRFHRFQPDARIAGRLEGSGGAAVAQTIDFDPVKCLNCSP
jgi:hypothetical protein